MSLIGQSAGLLFRIDGDSSGFQKEMRAVDGAIGNIGSKFDNIAGIAAVASAAITAIATAALAVGSTLVRLAFDASEFGSAIFDLQTKTGLAAETITTLKLAAESSGSSFETVGNSVSKFAVLIGKANQGNETAIATLEKYGITARDLPTALEQGVSAIAAMNDETLQAAASQELFKDKTGNTINTVKQLGGDLRKATEDAKRLGLTLSDEDVKAADDLGDAFGVLSLQIKAGAARFALQYAPQITAAITSISTFVASNQDAWRQWGRFVYDTITGTWNVLQGFGTAANNILSAISLGLINQSNSWSAWSYIIRGALAVVSGGITEIIWGLNKVGALINANKQLMSETDAGSQRDIMAGVAKTASISAGGPRGGGGGGGKGKSASGPTPEQLNREAFSERKDELGRMLDQYEAVSSRIIAKAELDVAKGLLDETKLAELKIAVAERVAAYRIAMLERELAAAQQYGQKTADIESRIGVQREALRELEYQNEAAQLKRTTEEKEKLAARIREIDERLSEELIAINQERQDNFIRSEEETWDEMIADQQGYTEEQNKLRGEAANYMVALFERERDRKLQVLTDQQAAEKAKIEKEVTDEEAKLKLLAALDELYKQRALLTEEEFQAELKKIKEKYSIPVDEKKYTITESMTGVAPSGWSDLLDQAVIADNAAAVAGIQALTNAFQGLGQAVGQVVSAWVLYGSAGTSVRKVTAQILAGIAQQAAVQAVFQLAEGFAKLAMAFFGVPNAGPSATAHFIAAGMYATIAGVAAIAGRATAGGSFNQATGQATGQSNGANGQTGNDPLRYTTQFNGYGGSENRLVATLDRINTTLGLVEETQNQFNEKITTMLPDEVVATGALGASRDIRDAVISELGSDVGTTDGMMRGLGFAR